MKVTFAAEVFRDLEDIGEYIARDNPGRARTFVGELAAKARDIGRTPLGFEVVGRYRDLAVRRRPYGAYLIFYRVRDGQVEIVRILHGSRDYEAVLFPDP